MSLKQVNVVWAQVAVSQRSQYFSFGYIFQPLPLPKRGVEL